MKPADPRSWGLSTRPKTWNLLWILCTARPQGRPRLMKITARRTLVLPNPPKSVEAISHKSSGLQFIESPRIPQGPPEQSWTIRESFDSIVGRKKRWLTDLISI
jgi:hypothetical protein